MGGWRYRWVGQLVQVMYIVNILPKVFILRIIKAPGCPWGNRSFHWSIARAAHGERRTGGGYVWRKVLADSPKESIEIDLISKIGNHDKRPLVQKNLDGEIVGEFLSIAHASRSLKISAEACHAPSAELRRQREATYGKRRWRMIFRFRNSRALDRGF